MVLSSICCLSFHGRLNQFDLSFLPVFMSKRISRQEGWVLANEMWFSGSLLILFCYPHHKNTDHGYCSLHQILCIFLLCTAAAIFGLILGQVSQPLGPLFPSPLPPQPKNRSLWPSFTNLERSSDSFSVFSYLTKTHRKQNNHDVLICLRYNPRLYNLLAVPSETIKYDPRLWSSFCLYATQGQAKGLGACPRRGFALRF